ncbi:Transcriptional regulator, ArsR family [plant metagenome]|uniref:Transcriptional regulator, ArsR family n=1 Tax=plant metagenome TaxID=1297885 RepID=A0A484RKT0_9ZZZZ
MPNIASLVGTAALVGDLARANMLMALMDGMAMTASELARVANITPQTASAHLARLTEAGLLAMEKQGRHRYHRLASPEVAKMLESIMTVAAGAEPSAPARRVVPGPRDQAMRYARTCYDHLAGSLAVRLSDSMISRKLLTLSGDQAELSGNGARFLLGLGIDLDTEALQAAQRRGGRAFCRPCLDWSERRPHLAGAVGALLCSHSLSQGWLRRIPGSRAVSLTPTGKAAFETAFGIIP